jgi:hypothetical protein
MIGLDRKYPPINCRRSVQSAGFMQRQRFGQQRSNVKRWRALRLRHIVRHKLERDIHCLLHGIGAI